MRNIIFYVICVLIMAAPAFAAGKKSKNASDDAIAQARAAAAAAEESSKDSALADEAHTSLTVNEGTSSAASNNDSAKAADLNAAAVNSEENKPLSQEQIKNMKESDIPLLGAEKSQKKSESSPWFRLITTVAVIGVLFGAASWGIKKYGKRANNLKGQSTKIRIVTNHHIGPKKSLMIVNVAGESLLLGVTDHNISILKNLSLLDEELPADVPKSFAGAINESFVENQGAQVGEHFNEQQHEDDYALQGLAQIKDKVSSRLKNMRQI